MPVNISREAIEFFIVTLISLLNIGWMIWSSKKKIQPEIEKLESEVAELIAQGAKVSVEMVLQRLSEARRSERDWRAYAAGLQKLLLDKGVQSPPFIPSDSDPKIEAIQKV